MAVNLDSGLYVCHRCQSKGRLVDGTIGASLDSNCRPAKFPFPRHPSSAAPPLPYATLSRDTRPLVQGERGGRYLECRGISRSLAASAGVRYSENWYGTAMVVFPLVAANGDVIAAHGRSIVGTQKRTRGPKSLAVFSLPDALHSDCFAIVEGPIDALSLAACGCPAVALVGTSWPNWLLERGYNRRVLLATDNDAVGDHAAATLGGLLGQFGANVVRLQPPQKDWNEHLVETGLDATFDTIAPIVFNGRPADDPLGNGAEDSLAWRILLSRLQLMTNVEAEGLRATLVRFRRMGAVLLDAHPGKRISHGVTLRRTNRC